MDQKSKLIWVQKILKSMYSFFIICISRNFLNNLHEYIDLAYDIVYNFDLSNQHLYLAKQILIKCLYYESVPTFQTHIPQTAAFTILTCIF